ncbi:transposase [Geobacter sp.]|uniref:transposase n=1 Tax=Geobacter sp. TaxID=46610 RepID=UPI0035A0AB4F
MLPGDGQARLSSRQVASEGHPEVEKIEVFYLPSYSPELNPDEYLNNSLKGRVHSGKRAQNAKQLESKARKHMRHLQNNRTKVKKFFEHPCAAYAS